MLFIKQAVLCLISLLHLSCRLAKWWIPKSHILKRVGEIYKRTSMKDLLKIRVKALALIAILLLSVVGGLSAKKIAIIDAGSSGSRLYVYDIDDNTKVLTVLYPATFKGDALSKIENTEIAVASFLTTMTSKYPGEGEEKIDLYVLATAGMRLVDGVTANQIYTKMRSTSLVGYELKRAMTISGQYEGLYAWIAANYRNNKLKWSDKKWSLDNPYAILEIGGASMQIAYSVPSVLTDNCIRHSRFGIIYSKSYLGGGVDQVYEKNKSKETSNFGVQLDVYLEGLNSQNLTFVRLGRPINDAIDNAKADSNVALMTYARSILTDDSDTKFHPKMNAKYIAYILKEWHLEGKTIKAGVPSDWTEGAALDIVVNDNTSPEAFNYSTRKPN